jgi:hypothetical protein
MSNKKEATTYTPKFLDTILFNGKREEKNNHLLFKESINRRLGNEFMKIAKVLKGSSS